MEKLDLPLGYKWAIDKNVVGTELFGTFCPWFFEPTPNFTLYKISEIESSKYMTKKTFPPKMLSCGSPQPLRYGKSSEKVGSI